MITEGPSLLSQPSGLTFGMVWSILVDGNLKAQILPWRMVNHGLPVASSLIDRNIDVSNVDCPHGSNHVESICHIFFQCHIAKAVWFASL